MKLKDYEVYKEKNMNASKSQLKEYIQIYAEIVKKTKSENGIELVDVKNNIKKAYLEEIYFTLVDEIKRPVKFTVVEGSKDYIIPIFTDMREYAIGSAKISTLFLDKLDLEIITPDDISRIAKEDKYFKGFVINPHSQNFNMDKDGNF